MTLTAWWACRTCGTRSPDASPAEVDKAAERHVRETKHTTVTHLVPKKE